MTAPAGDDPMRQTRTCNPIATGTPKQGTRPPYVLESADLVKPGSLIRRTDRPHMIAVRLVDGRGWNCGYENRPAFGAMAPEDEGWDWDSASGPVTVIAEGLTEAECRHLSGLGAQEALVWCEARKAPETTAVDVTGETTYIEELERRVKTKPQPGDAVPWDEVEVGCLYYDDSKDPECATFMGVHGGRQAWLDGHGNVERLLAGDTGRETIGRSSYRAILVASDLGTDPESWRRAMREWTANGNKPALKPTVNPPTPTLVSTKVSFTHPPGVWSAIACSAGGSQSLAIEVNGPDVRIRWASGVVTPLAALTVRNTPAPAADPLAPLRAAGILGRGPCDKATPERVVEMAIERLDALKRQVARLKTANEEARASLETPGRQGLRARLAKAEAERDAAARALEAQRATHLLWANEAQRRIDAYEVTLSGVRRDHARKAEAMRAVAEHQAGQLRTALHCCNEADEAMIRLAGDAASRAGFSSFGGTIPAVQAVISALSNRVADLKAELQKANQHHARSVFALTAQRDEARRSLAEEKIKTTRLDRAVVGGLAAQDALIRASNACGVRTGTWAELATGIVAEAARLRGLLVTHTGSDIAALVKPLRVAMGWTGPADAGPEQVVEAAANRCENAGKRYVEDQGRIADLRRQLDDQRRETTAATARAEKAERNLRAAAELLAA